MVNLVKELHWHTLCTRKIKVMRFVYKARTISVMYMCLLFTLLFSNITLPVPVHGPKDGDRLCWFY